ncbi:MAG: ECF-type sigma factor [Pirellulales bacterium]
MSELSSVDQSEVMAGTLTGTERALTSEIFTAIYQELRELAKRKLNREKTGQTLQPTALVHETFLRMAAGGLNPPWENRGQAFAAAAQMMRWVIIDNARRKRSLKNGGNWHRVDLPEIEMRFNVSPDSLLAIDEAFDRLTEDDPVAADVAKLRLFAGMTLEEVADSLQISPTTAHRNWVYARAFLQSCLVAPR